MESNEFYGKYFGRPLLHSLGLSLYLCFVREQKTSAKLQHEHGVTQAQNPAVLPPQLPGTYLFTPTRTPSAISNLIYTYSYLL